MCDRFVCNDQFVYVVYIVIRYKLVSCTLSK